MAERYVGIDLHRRRSVIHAMDADGKEISTVKIFNEPERLVTAVAAAVDGRDAGVGDRSLLEEEAVLGTGERCVVVGAEPAALHDLGRAGGPRGVMAAVPAHSHALYGKANGRAPGCHRR